MNFENKRIQIKNGKAAILRPVVPEDAQDMIAYMKQTAGETPFLLRTPDEVVFTVQAESELLEGILHDPYSVMIAAVVDGKLAGNCSLTPVGRKNRVKHRCSMGIALKQEYWGLGIGKQMLSYLFELAKQIGYEQMELNVVEGNDRARLLYEKCGFTETGRFINAMKYGNGTYQDEIVMVKMLNT